jgi:hypothetical protein
MCKVNFRDEEQAHHVHEESESCIWPSLDFAMLCGSLDVHEDMPGRVQVWNNEAAPAPAEVYWPNLRFDPQPSISYDDCI